MKYKDVLEGEFILRENRFISKVMINGEEHLCHVKNTGRCKELLLKGSKVFLNKKSGENRKTNYDLISVYKGDRLINIDSSAPNTMVYDFIKSKRLFDDITYIRSEVKFGDSRFDLYIERENEKVFIEVKGATLEENGIVMFPDAKTDRGVKHIKELMKAKECGYGAYIIFVIQMEGVKYFTPNYKTHKEFGLTLALAMENGVKALSFDSIVKRDEIYINKEVKVIL